ncbi:helix-turn-helix transcriptional regulator [Roseomonas sp. CCTCC AB2023176]|uniref:helix-turn-helix transcriptional regulator n=1 Tax=Roseomonas sp. CCTCC AB2023176 TaxID=3342640 RepID=UPI0035DBAA66
MQDDLLSTAEAADFLGLAKATLNKWRVERADGPKFVKIGANVRYRRSDLAAFIAENVHHCTAGYLHRPA